MMIELKVLNSERLSFLPGQFVNVMIPDKIARAYSISRYEYEANFEGDILELCVEYIEGGKGSEFFKNLSVNDEVILKGPFGRFTPSHYEFSTKELKKIDGRIILIGTGTGIVPLYNIVNDLSLKIAENRELLSYTEVVVLHGVRHENENYFDRRFTKLSEGFLELGVQYDYKLWVSQATEKYIGNKGRITNSLMNLLPRNTDEIYLCGNGATVLAIRGILIGQGFQDSQIHTERYN